MTIDKEIFKLNYYIRVFKIYIGEGKNMKKKLIMKGLVIEIIILFAGACVIPSMGGTIIERHVFQDNKTSFMGFNPSGNILYVGGTGGGNYTSIQDAIDNASDGDTVFVYAYSSIYYENIFVYKSINLIGEDRNTTVIDGDSKGDVVFISADWVNISEFTIQNSGSICYNAGIHIASDYINVSGNIITINTDIGVWLDSSNNNFITGNFINSNGLDGIRLDFSNSNIISDNSIKSNSLNGMVLYESNNNVILDNIISFNNEKGIIICNPSNNNIIYDNIILSNNKVGVYTNSSNNYIYHNNFINNLQNANDEGDNKWDNDYPSGGNYWSDYTGDDDNHGPNQDILGHDRIGDIPFEIPCEHGTDFYPLISPNGWFNEAPKNITLLDGRTYGKAGEEYTYTASANDSDGDPIYYKFDWGDGSYSDWVGPYSSGAEGSDSHGWSVGVFDIRVKAKDTRGLEIDWSDPFRVTMPRIKPFIFNFNLLSWLFKHFPNAYLILKYMEGRK